jgi:rhodanese-related sulfurtransferase
MAQSISAAEFNNLVASGKHIDLIDVRTPVEFREIHVEIARNEPLNRLDPRAIQAARNGSAGEPLYVVCRSGARGQQACEKFLAAGIANVVNIEGGTTACAAAGVPVVRGKRAIPLNCQVQILTGALVTVGSVLAMSLHPAWIALPVLMGVGLMFSGVTNTCAMGSMLARMPWNQVKPSASPTQASANDPSCTTKQSGSCCN